MLFDRALEKINSALKEATSKSIIVSYALIGGMAVSAWGMVRATKDIDFLVRLAKRESALSEFETVLKKHKIKFTARKGDFSDPIGLLIDLQVPVQAKHVSVQLIIATKLWEEKFSKTTVKVNIGESSIPVIKAEELIIMKLKAGGPLDIYDVKQLIKINKNSKNFDEKELIRKSKDMRIDKKLKRIMDE